MADTINTLPAYPDRVRALESEGMTTSDAQAVADAEVQAGTCAPDFFHIQLSTGTPSRPIIAQLAYTYGEWVEEPPTLNPFTGKMETRRSGLIMEISPVRRDGLHSVAYCWPGRTIRKLLARPYLLSELRKHFPGSIPDGAQ